MEGNRLREHDHSDGEGRRSLAAFLSTDKGVSLTRPIFESRSRPTASNPQHICVVTETYSPEINGVALTLAHLVNGLLARGHSVSVVHPKQSRQRASDGAGSNCQTEPILVRGLPLPGYHGLQFGMPSGRLLRRRSWRHPQPAVVYVAT